MIKYIFISSSSELQTALLTFHLEKCKTVMVSMELSQDFMHNRGSEPESKSEQGHLNM